MDDPQVNPDLISSVRDEYDSLRHVTEEHPCPYLPGRLSRSEVYLAEGMIAADYTASLGLGFRRSGRVVYRPRCRACRECRQLRVPVDRFAPTRSMRRVLRRNADVRVEVSYDPVPTAEKHRVFAAYLHGQHDGVMTEDFASFVSFLYDAPFPTMEYAYLLGDRIIGVSLADPCADGSSSVYMYFDPEHAHRSLGTFSVLHEIEDCRRRGLAYYYLGYYVAGSRTMAYKARFRPCEVLVGQHQWLTLPA